MLTDPDDGGGGWISGFLAELFNQHVRLSALCGHQPSHAVSTGRQPCGRARNDAHITRTVTHVRQPLCRPNTYTQTCKHVRTIVMSMSVSLCARLTRKKQPNFTKFCVHAACGRGSGGVVTLCTSSFPDDVMFSYNGGRRVVGRGTMLTSTDRQPLHRPTSTTQLQRNRQEGSHRVHTHC